MLWSIMTFSNILIMYLTKTEEKNMLEILLFYDDGDLNNCRWWHTELKIEGYIMCYLKKNILPIWSCFIPIYLTWYLENVHNA